MHSCYNEFSIVIHTASTMTVCKVLRLTQRLKTKPKRFVYNNDVIDSVVSSSLFASNSQISSIL